MKSVAELGRMDQNARIGEFSSLLRYLMLNRGDQDNAASMAEAQRAPQRVVEVLKAAVPAGSTADTQWGGALAPYRLLASAFVDQLRNASAAAALFEAVNRVPLDTQLGAILSGGSAGVVAQGAPIPVTLKNTGIVQVARQKVAAIVALTRELLRQQTAAEPLITRSLRADIGKALDVAVFDILDNGVTPMTSQGFADATNLINQVGLTTASRPYYVAAPDAAVRLAAANTNGVRWYPNATYRGGEIGGIPLLVSDGLAAGTFMLVDAARLFGGLELPEIHSSQNTLLQADTAPTGAAFTGSPGSVTALATTAAISTWQEQLVAVRVLQYFGISKLPGAVASVALIGSP